MSELLQWAAAIVMLVAGADIIARLRGRPVHVPAA